MAKAVAFEPVAGLVHGRERRDMFIHRERVAKGRREVVRHVRPGTLRVIGVDDVQYLQGSAGCCGIRRLARILVGAGRSLGDGEG